MQTPTTTDARSIARQILLQGKVQGLGIRPLVARLAHSMGLSGSVRNASSGVRIEVAGTAEQLETLNTRLRCELPGEISLIVTSSSPALLLQRSGFVIAPSQTQGMVATIVPTDRRVCRECISEVEDPSNRRFRDPFATCTHCGPRFSLIQSLPYDRQRTAMDSFVMCPDCQDEYRSSNDRRFHSQTNSCPKCGPRIWLRNSEHEVIANDDDAVRAASEALRRGCVVGIRGVGGYQWMVDASGHEAVSKLRELKQRPEKPFAVMLADRCAAASIALIDPLGADALDSPANPIVIFERRPVSVIDSAVYGGLATIGVMLPSTPLHQMIAQAVDRPLVITSGNLEGDPIPFEISENRIAQAFVNADFTIEHNRVISRPVDDSLVQPIAGRVATFRLGRGLAPLHLDFPSLEVLSGVACDSHSLTGSVLAVGGHQKSAIAVFNGSQAILGPHLGDLDLDSCRHRYESQVRSICDLYQMKPSLIVHDFHPDYHSTRWAGAQGTPTLAVQHHHAHVVSMMLQEKWLDRTVLGVAWDGTGYGTDGTVWGGEFLVTTIDRFERVASLLPFPLVGGDTAIRQPWRVAVSLVHQAFGPAAARNLTFADVSTVEINRLVATLDRRHSHLAVATSSVGRLFDGIAALVLGITRCRHEGQPAILLEQACQQDEPGYYPVQWLDHSPRRLDWRPMIQAILDDIAKGDPQGAIAMRFHRSMAFAIVDVWRMFPDLPAVLSGGCFQNRVLVELLAHAASDFAQPLATPGVIPVGDGGIAAGQLAIGIRHHFGNTSDRDPNPCV